MGITNVTVVHELLYTSHHSSKFLTRDDLQRLDVDLAVLGGTDSME